MNPTKPIEKYRKLSDVVRELGVEGSVARILRASDQSAFDEIRPRGGVWGQVGGSPQRRGWTAPLGVGRPAVSEGAR